MGSTMIFKMVDGSEYLVRCDVPWGDGARLIVQMMTLETLEEQKALIHNSDLYLKGQLEER